MSEDICRWGILGTAGIAKKNWQSIKNAGNARLVAVAALASGADATVTSTSTFERCVNDEPCEERLTMQVRGPPQKRGGRWAFPPPR